MDLGSNSKSRNIHSNVRPNTEPPTVVKALVSSGLLWVTCCMSGAKDWHTQKNHCFGIMETFKIPLDNDTMKSSQHRYGEGWEGNESRERHLALRKVMEKVGSKTQSRSQVFWLGVLQEENPSPRELLSQHSAEVTAEGTV